MCAKTGRKLRTLCVLLLSSTVLAALLTAFFPQLSLVSFACCAVFLMMLCREQSGRVVMMLFALLIVPLPSVMSSGDGSAALAVSSVLFSAAAGALRSVLSETSPIISLIWGTSQYMRTGSSGVRSGMTPCRLT